MFSRISKRGKAEVFQHQLKALYSVIPEHFHGRYIKGSRQGLAGCHSSFIFPVKILGSKPGKIYRYICDKTVGKNFTIVQHGGIQDWFKYASGAPG